MIHFLVPGQHADFIDDYIRRTGEWAQDHVSALPYREAVGKDRLPYGRYVFAGLDRLGPQASRLLGDLHEQIRLGSSAPPLNHPLQSLRRHELLNALHGAGINRFRAFGAWEDLSDVRYPAFVRHRSRDGGVPRLLHSRREVEMELGRTLLDGGSMEELLVVEFLQTRGDDGFYRKYAAHYVDGRVIPSGVGFSTNWVVRGVTQEFPEWSFQEEKEYVLGNPHEEEVSSVFRMARIEFGRIDYSLHEGQIQVWEINTLPMMRRPPGSEPVPEEIQALRAYRREINSERFLAAWKAADAKNGVGSSIPVRLDPDRVAEGHRELAVAVPYTYPKAGRFPAVRGLLRPLKPILKPMAERVLFPLLSSRARKKEDRRG